MARHPRSRIGRGPSTLTRLALPILSTMFASMAPLWPAIAVSPVLPPWGLMMFLAWRMLHRNVWSSWTPLLLGLFDDMFSGQPIGSAMVLWTLALLTLDILDRRMVWRDFQQEWGIAAAAIAAILFGELIFAHATGGATNVFFIVPQLVISLLVFPLVARACAALDSWRTM